MHLPDTYLIEPHGMSLFQNKARRSSSETVDGVESVDRGQKMFVWRMLFQTVRTSNETALHANTQQQRRKRNEI